MKRSEIKRRPLADTVLASLEPEEVDYREYYGSDDEKIYFFVSKKGNKRWDLRYKDSHGKWRWAGLGAYPDTTIKMAKQKAKTFLEELNKEGTSPVDKKKEEKQDTSVKGIFKLFYEKQKLSKVSSKELSHMQSTFDNHVFPFIGNKSAVKVTIKDCTDIQKRLQERGTFSTADKVRGWLNRTFRHAIASGIISHNPASYMIDVSIKRPKSKNFPHLLEPELPNFLRALRNSHSTVPVKTAAWMSIYTATRPGMVRWAEWSEIDFINKIWTIPAEKMKRDNDQIIYLTDQVLTLIENLRPHTGYSKYLFPSDRSEKIPVISDGTINKAFSIIGYKNRMTGHGSRHTFKTLTSEHGWEDKWSEAQLAHAKKGMEEIYNKAKYLHPRATMMQWYNDYLDALERGITETELKHFKKRVNKTSDYDD